jgi:hypothetical protein
MSTLTLGQKAIGQQDGDTLTLSNQWARVYITLWADPLQYVVTGDLLDTRLQRLECRTMGAAISYAMQSLAAYQEGRA